MLKFVVLFTCFFQVLAAAENPSILYISQYKEVAIAEMQRTGIPASIKMAQALLESGAGRSTLATKANNHFGIKCGGEWNGKTFYRKDDDYKDGKLIESCFRKFSSPDESFIAHSQFLRHQKRYAFLFDFDKNDYHKWANGLKKAGYATDSAYPKKLINLIEKYQLFLLDNENAQIAENDARPNPVPVKKSRKSTNEKSEKTKSEKKSRSRSNTETRKSKSKKNRSPKRTKKKRNSKKSEKSSERKSRNKSSRRSSKKESKRSSKKTTSVFHIVTEGQTIYEISKRYGIKESAIRLRNRIPKNAEVLAGEKIYLRKKVRILDQPQYYKTNRSSKRAQKDKFIF